MGVQTKKRKGWRDVVRAKKANQPAEAAVRAATEMALEMQTTANV
jgi:hypothetical protein